MNVLMVEDDYRVWDFAGVLENRGHYVKPVDNLHDAIYELDGKGQRVYDAVLLDLAVDGRDLPDDNMKKKVINDRIPAGCVFHTDVMTHRYKELAQKTILFTGLSQIAKETAPEWYKENLHYIVLKTESDYIDRILSLLKVWENCEH